MYKNKVVLITGASRGVGLLIAEYFLNKGAIVIGLSRRENSNISHDNYFHFSVDLGNPECVSN